MMMERRWCPQCNLFALPHEHTSRGELERLAQPRALVPHVVKGSLPRGFRPELHDCEDLAVRRPEPELRLSAPPAPSIVPLIFPNLVVAGGATAMVPSHPVPYRSTPVGLQVPPEIGPSFALCQIYAGSTLTFVSAQGSMVSLSLFSEARARDNLRGMVATADAGDVIRLEIVNRSGCALTFGALMFLERS
jgi:hypothetical protein